MRPEVRGLGGQDPEKLAGRAEFYHRREITTCPSSLKKKKKKASYVDDSLQLESTMEALDKCHCSLMADRDLYGSVTRVLHVRMLGWVIRDVPIRVVRSAASWSSTLEQRVGKGVHLPLPCIFQSGTQQCPSVLSLPPTPSFLPFPLLSLPRFVE